MISDNNGGLPRYCHPYHGGWDVARIALDIPQSMILFVCPASCARIIKLNAINYGYSERIFVLGLTEADIVAGDYEKKTYEAACEVMDTIEKRPRALIIYVSCIDAMLGNDHSFQTRRVMEKYPGVNCFVLKMCPITRYSTDLPLVELQNDMYMALPDRNEEASEAASADMGGNEEVSEAASADMDADEASKQKTVAFIGSNIALNEDNEIIKMLREGGYRPLHIQASDSYEDFLRVRDSVLNICFMPFGRKACESLKNRFGTDYVPVYFRHDMDYIDSVLKEISTRLKLRLPDIVKLRSETLKVLKAASERIKKEIVLDSTASMAVMELRRLLEECGFRVRYIYRDSADTQAPDVDSGHILMPSRRRYCGKSDCLAIGGAAGCFEKAEKTADIFYDNGSWGYDYLNKLAVKLLETEGMADLEKMKVTGNI